MTTYLLTEEARAAKKELPVAAQATLLDVLEALREEPTAGRRLRGTPIWIHKHPNQNLQITYRFDEEEDVIEFLDFVAAVVEVERHIFISYSHDDEDWFEILRAKLEILEDLGVEFWADTEIGAGEKWEEEIRARLDSAKAALLMISRSFLDSEFIRTTELPALLEAAASHGGDSGFKLLWFLVSQCDLGADPLARRIANYQALHDPGKPLDRIRKKKRDAVLDRILKKIARAVAK